MGSALTGSADQGAAWIVALEAALCWGSLRVALHLARSAHGSAVRLTAARLCAGSGLWCTHFLGLLAAEPGRMSGEALAAATAVLAACSVVRAGSPAAGAAGAGLVLAVGAAAMAGIEPAPRLPEATGSAWPLVACGLASGLALLAADRGPAKRSGLRVAGVIAAATVFLQAIAGLAVAPGPDLLEPGVTSVLHRLALSAGLVAALAILGAGMLGLAPERACPSPDAGSLSGPRPRGRSASQVAQARPGVAAL